MGVIVGVGYGVRVGVDVAVAEGTGVAVSVGVAVSGTNAGTSLGAKPNAEATIPKVMTLPITHIHILWFGTREPGSDDVGETG